MKMALDEAIANAIFCGGWQHPQASHLAIRTESMIVRYRRSRDSWRPSPPENAGYSRRRPNGQIEGAKRFSLHQIVHDMDSLQQARPFCYTMPMQLAEMSEFASSCSSSH